MTTFRYLPVAALVGAALLPLRRQGPVATTATADLIIGGSEDAPEPYSFVAISGLAFAPDGRIVVTDMREHVVRVFEPSGRFVYAIGREGAGPGEFRFPVSASFDREGLLWVRDDGNRRLNAYALGRDHATFRMSVRAEHLPAMSRVEPIGFDDEGRLISAGAVGSPGDTRRPARFLIARDGSVVHVDTLPPAPADSIGDRVVTRGGPRAGDSHTFFYYQPFGPTFVVAYSLRGEWARAITSRYDVEWFGSDGRHLRTVQQSVQGPLLSRAERERGRKSIDDFLARAHVAASSVPGLPNRKTPVRGIAFDSDGHLWIERSVAEGAPREADVYDARGRRMSTVRWDPRVELLDLQLVATSGSHVLGVARDSLGVEGVVRLRWR